MKFSTGSVSIIFIPLIFAAFVVFAGWADPFDDRSFDAGEWAAASQSSDERASMAHEVVARVRGLNQEQVLDMLGEPDKRLSSRVDAGGNRLRGVVVFSYHLGCWSGYGFDDAFIYIHFDADGVAVNSEVTGY